MGYLKFDKAQLVNLEYSLNKEVIRSNRAGSYASTTIINCNTRKYHGLLVCPLDSFGGTRHVLLSSLDTTVIQQGKEFHLAVHKYPGSVHAGHKYVRNFDSDPIPTITYRVGGVVLTRETMLVEEAEQVLVRYTLVDAHSPTTLRFNPFLAFRGIHQLSKRNDRVRDEALPIKNGVAVSLYPGYPYLNMQLSKEAHYVHAPQWFENVEYFKEKERGYDYHEDIFNTGYFEVEIEKDESIVFSASLKEEAPNGFKSKFTNQVKKRIPRDSYMGCLENAAQQFFNRQEEGQTYVLAGFPWFGTISRNVFGSLPGLTLPGDDLKTFEAVLDTLVAHQQGPLFPSIIERKEEGNMSVDTPLWFIWSLQQFMARGGADAARLWKKYGTNIRQVLEGFRDGADHGIKMAETGLLAAGREDIFVTWMDAYAYGAPVTPRNGYAVEVQALWYNAIRFALELAKANGQAEFEQEWEAVAQRIEQNFTRVFWDEKRQYLADYVNWGKKDMSIRPNMVFVASMPYSPVDDYVKNAVLSVVKTHLLTPRGLRTLSPSDPGYRSVFAGSIDERYMAYHQGTAWPWLLGHYAEAYLRLHERTGLSHVKKIFDGFEAGLNEHGLGTISEVYDGDPPHDGRGAISSAWSVAELLRMKHLIDQFA